MNIWNREDLISQLKENFNIKELVCKHCYDAFGEKAWDFLTTNVLQTLYVLRNEIFKAPICINNWSNKGSYSQRGLRCNMCDLVKSKTKIYMSQHCLGNAFDFTVEGYDIKLCHDLIELNKDKFISPIRLEAIESAPTWMHIDCRPHNCGKIQIFK